VKQAITLDVKTQLIYIISGDLSPGTEKAMLSYRPQQLPANNMPTANPSLQLLSKDKKWATKASWEPEDIPTSLLSV